MHLLELLQALLALRDGDFSVRLPCEWLGLEGKLADAVNEIACANQRMAHQLEHVAYAVARGSTTRQRIKLPRSVGAWADMEDAANALLAHPARDALVPAEQGHARGGLWKDLADAVHHMATELRRATDPGAAQHWQCTHFTRLMTLLQGRRELADIGRILLSELAPIVAVQQGVIYCCVAGEPPYLQRLATYAEPHGGEHPDVLAFGHGRIGQCALEKRRIVVDDASTDAMRPGAAHTGGARSVVVLPILFDGEVEAVIELVALGSFTDSHHAFLDLVASSLGFVFDAARNREAEHKNRELEAARRALEDRAEALALASKYKSEFLASMSHELRTPLNSILILGQQLGENPERNLTPRQVEFARTIHAAGADLLHLVGDILDLSKIEAGTVTIEAEELFFATLSNTLARMFRPEAERKHLAFDVRVDAELGRSLVTDAVRLQQILKHLLSNAFKFTARGGVHLHVSAVTDGFTPDHPVLSKASAVIAFSVSDTGIGIPQDRQRLVFEAFQQADTGTRHRYGGTGLGLAISRELASLLGGEMKLESTSGHGSTFTLYLPREYVGPIEGKAPPEREVVPPRAPEHEVRRIPDDREHLQPGDRSLLVVDHDPDRARVLAELTRAAGWKALVATRGAEALTLARELRPSAISLGVALPDMPGWTVLRHLKQDLATRHVPVQLIAQADERSRALARGAYAFVDEPAPREALVQALDRLQHHTRRRKQLLVVQSNAARCDRIVKLLGHDDIDIAVAATGAEALVRIAAAPPGCVVLDLSLPDMHGFDVLARIRDDVEAPEVPVVVFTGQPLTAEEDAELQRLSRGMLVEGVESPERLFDRTSLFLHRAVTELPPAKRKLLDRLYASDEDLVDRTVLVVDDDVRNVFALSSVLERHGMKVLAAHTGREALARLEATPGIGIVLVDGRETIARIRKQPAFRRVPIVALTARATQGEREQCLEVGASDHLPMPVNPDELLASLRSWLHR